MNRDDVFIWLSLFWFVPMRVGDLDAAIRLIAGDSDDRQCWPPSYVDRARNRRQP